MVSQLLLITYLLTYCRSSSSVDAVVSLLFIAVCHDVMGATPLTDFLGNWRFAPAWNVMTKY